MRFVSPLVAAARWAVLNGLLGALTACGQSSPSSSPPSSRRMQPYQSDKFKLTAGPCAADDYWVTIQGGTFIGSEGRNLTVPSGHTLEGDWGASGTVWSSGDDMHAAPEVRSKKILEEMAARSPGSPLPPFEEGPPDNSYLPIRLEIAG